MNRTKIEWTNYSWNPITGWNHNCWYCYAKKLTQRFPKNFPNGFKPTFHPRRLKEPHEVKKPSKIFVCSIADLWGPWTNPAWRNIVLDSMYICPVKHQFQMLTKNPENIPKANQVKFPNNWWFGTTVTTENGDERNIEEIKKVDAGVRFVSFEPLLGPINLEKYSLKGLDWVIVGKLTGSKRIKLRYSWVIAIQEECLLHKIPLFQKENLRLNNPIQQFPVTKK